MYEKLLAVQKEIGAIKKDSTNPFFKSNYFDINAILAVVKPILNKHGIILLQGLCTVEGRIGLSTTLKNDKETIEVQFPLPECADAQKYGSAITYFRRYALQSLLALEAEDDDANHASGKVTPKTVTITKKLNEDPF